MAIAALSVGTSASGVVMSARAFRVAVRFALGHALLLLAGSLAVIGAGWHVPIILERAGEVVGGCVLISLGAIGCWIILTRRLYGHTHPYGSPPHPHWHLHLGRPEHHPEQTRHSHVPTMLGAVFAVSGLRALTLLAPVSLTGPSAPESLVTMVMLLTAFALGILLAMTLVGILLARAFGSAWISRLVAPVAAGLTAVGSIALGAYWIVGRSGA